MPSLVFATFHPGCDCEMNLVTDGHVTRVPVNYAARLHLREIFLRADKHPYRPCKFRFSTGSDLVELELSFQQRKNIEEVFLSADRYEHQDILKAPTP